ncbi:hypothetical protein CK247_30785, partial [Klebsiella pneumoniae]
AMLLGFLAEVRALIHTIPGPVIGGASIVVFGLTLVFVAAALIAMLLGFLAEVRALIHTIPGPVIGGASIVVFGL